jgi:hypothetical protein
MQVLTHDEDNGFSIDGIRITPQQVCDLKEPVLCYDLLEPLAGLGPAVAPAVERGIFNDLRVAGYLHCAAADCPKGAKLSDFGESIQDAAWILRKVPPKSLALLIRGRIALAACEITGMPVDSSRLKICASALVDTAQQIAEELSDSAPSILETKQGEIVQDEHGLPILVDSVTRHAIWQSVLEQHDVRIDLQTPLSEVANKYPDNEFTQSVMRYKRIVRDIKRMRKVGKSGRLHCTVEIDQHGMNRFSSPSVGERNIRQCIGGLDDMIVVDFACLDLQVAKRISSQLGRPLWANFDQYSEIGAVATAGKGSTRRHDSIGRHMVRSVITDGSIAALAVRLFPRLPMGKSIVLLKQYVTRVMQGVRDPWQNDKLTLLAQNLGAVDSASMLTALGGEPGVDAARTIVLYGNDPISPYPQEYVKHVWKVLADECQDMELRHSLEHCVHSGKLHEDLFAETAAAWCGRRVTGVNRAAAGLWSVYGTVHDVLREFLWLVYKHGGEPYAAHECQALCSGISLDDALSLSELAMIRVLGDSWCYVHATKTRRWK